jgi:hypothetical protein
VAPPPQGFCLANGSTQAAGPFSFYREFLPTPGLSTEWQEEGHELSVRLVRPDRAEEVMLTIPLQMEEAPPLKTPGSEAAAVVLSHSPGRLATTASIRSSSTWIRGAAKRRDQRSSGVGPSPMPPARKATPRPSDGPAPPRAAGRPWRAGRYRRRRRRHT